eukprot:jgi/Antlo1/300/288
MQKVLLLLEEIKMRSAVYFDFAYSHRVRLFTPGLPCRVSMMHGSPHVGAT